MEKNKFSFGFGVMLNDKKHPMYYEGLIDMANYVLELMKDYDRVCVDVEYDYEQWLTMHMDRAKALAEKRQGDVLEDMADVESRSTGPKEQYEQVKI